LLSDDCDWYVSAGSPGDPRGSTALDSGQVPAPNDLGDHEADRTAAVNFDYFAVGIYVVARRDAVPV
jgi:hypothetical protein